MLFLGDADIATYMKITDPGFGALMWLGANNGLNIWFVHVLGGAIFAYGLVRFCLKESHPWLAMTVAIPYLVIVVAMGYDRQAVAIGFVMLAMVALRDRSMQMFAGNMVLATSMHVTALSLMPVFVLGSRINKWWAAIISAPIFAIGYSYFLHDRVESSITGYVDTGYSSSGAAIRIAMNALPAAAYFVFRRRFELDDDERRFADVLALVALAFVALLAVSPSSTAVDRVALYIIPLQLFVLGRLPSALAHSEQGYKALVAAVVAYSAAAMVVWLNFADNAPAWVPYSLFDSDQLLGLSY
jgi:hypothetical protein